MLRRVEFTEKPERFELESKNGTVVVSLHDNIEEGINQEGDKTWYADVYRVMMADAPNLRERISRGFERFLAKARADEAEAEARKEAEAAKLSMDDLTEITVDQEFRICMLELGVEL